MVSIKPTDEECKAYCPHGYKAPLSVDARLISYRTFQGQQHKESGVPPRGAHAGERRETRGESRETRGDSLACASPENLGYDHLSSANTLQQQQQQQHTSSQGAPGSAAAGGGGTGGAAKMRFHETLGPSAFNCLV